MINFAFINASNVIRVNNLNTFLVNYLKFILITSLDTQWLVVQTADMWLYKFKVLPSKCANHFGVLSNSVLFQAYSLLLPFLKLSHVYFFHPRQSQRTDLLLIFGFFGV